MSDVDNDDYDISGRIGPLAETENQISPEWPMYAFDSPALALWTAIGNALTRQGWTKAEVKGWLQSEEAFWAMDGGLGDCIRALGQAFGAEIARRYPARRRQQKDTTT